EWINSLSLPCRIEFWHFASHSERCADRCFGIFLRAMTAHVSPDRHDRVADKFVEGAAIIEHHWNHRAEVSIELRDQHCRIGALRDTGESNQVRKKDSHRF